MKDRPALDLSIIMRVSKIILVFSDWGDGIV